MLEQLEKLRKRGIFEAKERKEKDSERCLSLSEQVELYYFISSTYYSSPGFLPTFGNALFSHSIHYATFLPLLNISSLLVWSPDRSLSPSFLHHPLFDPFPNERGQDSGQEMIPTSSFSSCLGYCFLPPFSSCCCASFTCFSLSFSLPSAEEKEEEDLHSLFLDLHTPLFCFSLSLLIVTQQFINLLISSVQASNWSQSKKNTLPPDIGSYTDTVSRYTPNQVSSNSHIIIINRQQHHH